MSSIDVEKPSGEGFSSTFARLLAEADCFANVHVLYPTSFLVSSVFGGCLRRGPVRLTYDHFRYSHIVQFSKSMKARPLNNAFTLIELLVVIAIIGLLSSIILASLNTARAQARATALKASAGEFRKLMELEYLDTGSYANLNRGWTGTTVECANRGYGGTYAAMAVNICNQIRSQISNKSQNDFYTGVNTSAGFSNSTQYSIIVRMPSGQYYCVGSSGGNSDGNVNNGVWPGTGCYGNP